jgi:hypothetical protein
MKRDPSPDPGPNGSSRRDKRFAAVLIVCILLVAFWEIMANLSRRPFQPFQITAADFSNFEPAPGRWDIRPVAVHQSRIEPNILAYALRRRPGAPEPPGGAPFGTAFVRLVHGYNMPDCMRIKRFKVELLDDRRKPGGEAQGGLDGRAPSPAAMRVQVWRLTSELGDVSVCVTSMMRVGDFDETDDDVRSMAYPKIGTPDDPSWLPRGMTWSSLKHPIRNFGLLVRAKWNNAHCNVAAFLRLKQPATACDDLLTLVSTSTETTVKPEQEAAALAGVLEAHAFLYSELKAWRQPGVRSSP